MDGQMDRWMERDGGMDGRLDRQRDSKRTMTYIYHCKKKLVIGHARNNLGRDQETNGSDFACSLPTFRHYRSFPLSQHHVREVFNVETFVFQTFFLCEGKETLIIQTASQNCA